MLWEHDACVVVMLTGRPPQARNGGAYDAHAPPERYGEYWPAEGAMRYGDMIVDFNSSHETAEWIVREFKIVNTMVSVWRRRRRRRACDTRCNARRLQTHDSRTIRHFQYLCWPDHADAGVDVEELNRFIDVTVSRLADARAQSCGPSVHAHSHACLQINKTKKMFGLEVK